jgi:hypothetical protein
MNWTQLRLAFIEDIQREMKRWYPLLLENAWNDAGATLGLDLSFELENSFVQQILDQLFLEVRSVSDTTIADGQALISRQAQEGWSVQELAQQIRQLAEIQSPKRALAISRTETAKAYTLGTLEAYHQSNVVSGTEWLLGPEPCELCQELARTTPTAELGKEYAPGVVGPPLHPNCTCAIAAIVE